MLFFNVFNLEGEGINTANSPKLAKPRSRAKATPSLTRITIPKEIDLSVTFFLFNKSLDLDKISSWRDLCPKLKEKIYKMSDENY